MFTVPVDIDGFNYSNVVDDQWAASLGGLALRGDELMARLAVVTASREECMFVFDNTPPHPDPSAGTVFCDLTANERTTTVKCDGTGWGGPSLEGNFHQIINLRCSVPAQLPDSLVLRVSWDRFPNAGRCSVEIVKEQLERARSGGGNA